MEENYQIGDFIIDFVCIYKITSIESTTKNGNLIHFQPIKGTDKIFTDTTPENNFEKSGLRHLLTKKEIKSVLNSFKIPEEDHLFDLRQFKEDLYSNNIKKLISDLKCFYHQEKSLIKTEEELKDMILNHFCLEISFVTDKKFSNIKKTIESSILGK
jgi:RNA polymerase-interacting CarD/CdnL/TRCF family regulator